MPHIANGFNRLAVFYTFLSRLMFGKTLEKSQQYFLTAIHANDRVLILGGGSGNLLKSLLSHQPHLAVDYIDISEKMIQLAREKNQNPPTVTFIVGTEQDIPNRTYTVVITNFYLDLFSDHTLPLVVKKIKAQLQPGGQWLVTDFVSKKSWHRIILWYMYRFFRIAAGIEACSLPSWEKHIEQAGFTETDSKFFFNGFIKSCRYTDRRSQL